MDICKGEISSERKWKIQNVSVYARDGGKLLMRKRSFSFLVLFRLPIFQFEGHTLIRWYTVHEITRYSPFILLFPFTILFFDINLYHTTFIIYISLLYTAFLCIYWQKHIQQAKVHFKYFILTIRYGIMVNNNTLCFKKDVLMLSFKLEYRASTTKIRSFFC